MKTVEIVTLITNDGRQYVDIDDLRNLLKQQAIESPGISGKNLADYLIIELTKLKHRNKKA